MFFIQYIIDFVLKNLGSFTAYLLIISVVKHIYNIWKSRKHLPPGPTGLPVVGYLPFLGKEPHKDIAKLSEKYGNIFTLQLGMHNVVVLNDWEVVKDALHKDQFLGRPHESPFSLVTDNMSIFNDNGSVWREHRRLLVKFLTELEKGDLEQNINEEINHFISNIDETNGQSFDIHSILSTCMSDNISKLVFGHRFEFNERKKTLLDKRLDISSKLFSQIGLLSLSPIWLSKMISKLNFSTDSKVEQMVRSLFKNEISNHKKTFKTHNKHNYIDTYLEEMEMKVKKNPIITSFNDLKLEANCRALFEAGSETVGLTIEWALVFAAHYRQHQKHIHQEIDAVIGKNRIPVWGDSRQMPFTQAFINEIFRFKTIIPLNLMRISLEDSSILGHFIHKNTRILINIWAVHHDPKLWDNPDQFNPYRFLTDDQKDLIKTESLIPFSSGKRSCAGETMGRVEVFLYLTSLLQLYRISATDDQMSVFEDRLGLTLESTNTSVLRFEKRLKIYPIY